MDADGVRREWMGGLATGKGKAKAALGTGGWPLATEQSKDAGTASGRPSPQPSPALGGGDRQGMRASFLARYLGNL